MFRANALLFCDALAALPPALMVGNDLMKDHIEDGAEGEAVAPPLGRITGYPTGRLATIHSDRALPYS